MTFRRLTTPATDGSYVAPPGATWPFPSYGYINKDPAGIDRAPMDTFVDGSQENNVGTFFVAFQDDASSSFANRPHWALSVNTDALDDIVHKPVSYIPRRTPTMGDDSNELVIDGGWVWTGNSYDVDPATWVKVTNRAAAYDDWDLVHNDVSAFKKIICTDIFQGGVSVLHTGFVDAGLSPVTFIFNYVITSTTACWLYFASRTSVATMTAGDQLRHLLSPSVLDGTLYNILKLIRGDTEALDAPVAISLQTALSEINELQSDMTTAQGDINTLQSDLTTLQGVVGGVDANVHTLADELTAFPDVAHTWTATQEVKGCPVGVFDSRVPVFTTVGAGTQNYGYSLLWMADGAGDVKIRLYSTNYGFVISVNAAYLWYSADPTNYYWVPDHVSAPASYYLFKSDGQVRRFTSRYAANPIVFVDETPYDLVVTNSYTLTGSSESDMAETLFDTESTSWQGVVETVAASPGSPPYIFNVYAEVPLPAVKKGDIVEVSYNALMVAYTSNNVTEHAFVDMEFSVPTPPGNPSPAPIHVEIPGTLVRVRAEANNYSDLNSYHSVSGHGTLVLSMSALTVDGVYDAHARLRIKVGDGVPGHVRICRSISITAKVYRRPST